MLSSNTVQMPKDRERKRDGDRRGLGDSGLGLVVGPTLVAASNWQQLLNQGGEGYDTIVLTVLE